MLTRLKYLPARLYFELLISNRGHAKPRNPDPYPQQVYLKSLRCRCSVQCRARGRRRTRSSHHPVHGIAEQTVTESRRCSLLLFRFFTSLLAKDNSPSPSAAPRSPSPNPAPPPYHAARSGPRAAGALLGPGTRIASTKSTLALTRDPAPSS